MYSLDVIDYTSATEKHILVVANEASIRLFDAFQRAAPAYVPGLPKVAFTVPGEGQTFPVPDIRRSDHASFWDQGYQAMIVTDTANFRNPNHHQPTDTIDTLDLPFATNVTKAMLATLIDYAAHDADADGQPDACTGPLAATPTAILPATATAAPAAPTAAATGTVASTGVTLPDTGDGAGDEGTSVYVLIAGIAGAAVLLTLPFPVRMWVWRREP